MASTGAAAEWRAGWPLPIVSAIGYAAGIAYLYSLGLFIEPLEQEFGWSRVAITSGLTIVSAVVVVFAPFSGVFIDRWGARRVAVPGLVLYCLALAGLSFAGPEIWSWWGLWVFVAFGALCTQAAVWTSAVASRFDRSRGLAMAITLCGAGIGSALVPILANQYIDQFGWRGAYVALGATAALALPLVVLFFHDAVDKSRRSGGSATRDRDALPGISVRTAMLSTRFLRLAFISLAVVTAMTSMLVHFVPMMTAKGLSKDAAAAAAGLIGIGSITGRLAGGFFLDRVSGALVGAVAFSLPIIVAISLLGYEGDGTAAFALAFLLGLSLGGEVDVIAYLTTRYFGLKNFGTLFATIIALQTLALGIGPLIAGYVYDRFGEYDPLLIGIVPVFVLSAGLIATLGPYPTHSVEDGGDDGSVAAPAPAH